VNALIKPALSDRGFALDRGYVRQAPRYSFVIDVEVTDIQSGVRIRGRTKTLSLLGYGLDTLKLFPKGTNVSLRLSFKGAESNVLARVVHANPELGMGIAFTSVAREDGRILEWWLAEYVSIPNREK